ncbi:MAG TPA: peptide ABC transporter substrate-binding protein [Desulfobacteraceae bacterium]|nr:peptide ABC transporter substrate-binding protein [Desulfobacteraceae bacterium]
MHKSQFSYGLCLTLTLLIVQLIASLAYAKPSTILDQNGTPIPAKRPYTKIISLYGAHTENLFYLGAAAQVIGVSVNDDYPEEVSTKQRFSYHDDPEKYLAAMPDLVLIRPMIANGYPGFVKQLRSYGITVASFQPKTIKDMYSYWLTLGVLTGKTRSAEKLVSRFKSSVNMIRSVTGKIHPKKRVYFQAIHRRMRTFTPGAMPIFALETAGGINVASDAKASRNTNVAVYGKEQILSKADRIDVFLAQNGIMNPVTLTDILTEPGFHVIKAIKESRVFLIDESIVSRPVPRLLDGILTIGTTLYPEIFNSIDIKKDLL